MKFGEMIMVGRYIRYRVFCHVCRKPLAWPETPDPQVRYSCELHEGTPTPITPPKAWAKGVKDEDGGGNSFDDIVGMHEDGRD